MGLIYCQDLAVCELTAAMARRFLLHSFVYDFKTAAGSTHFRFAHAYVSNYEKKITETEIGYCLHKNVYI